MCVGVVVLDDEDDDVVGSGCLYTSDILPWLPFSSFLSDLSSPLSFFLSCFSF